MEKWKTFTASFTAKHLFLAGSIIILVTALIWFAFFGLNSALWFDGPASDGSFQILNPLRRIAAGQAIGRDFNYFHGSAIPYLHYPIFALLGSNLFASEISKNTISPLVFLLSTYAFMYAVMRKKVTALVLSAATLLIAMRAYNFLIFSNNALLGVRSFMTVLVACVIIRRDSLQKPLINKYWLRHIKRYEFLSALTLSIGFVMGTEFGVEAILAYVVISLLASDEKVLKRITSLVITGSLTIIMTFALLMLMTQGHPIEPLVYALKDIPSDQFWYFGAPPNQFIYTGNIWHLLGRDRLIRSSYLLFILAIGATYAYRRKYKKTALYYGFVFLLIAGFFSQISMLGYYIYTETYPLARLSSLVLIAIMGIFIAREGLPTIKMKFPQRIRCIRSHSFNINRSTLTRILAAVFLVIAIQQGSYYIAITRAQQEPRNTLVRLKDKILHHDEQNISYYWQDTLSAVMPIIQQNNSYDIAPYNQKGFIDGVNTVTNTVTVSAQHSVLKPGSIVYLAQIGRSVVQSVKSEAGLTYVEIKDPARQLDPSLDGNPRKLVVEKDFIGKPSTLWSTYTGLVDYEKGSLNSSSQGADYIIHALGKDKRQQYTNDFAKSQPDYVLTLQKPSSVFEEWLQDDNWSFYNPLLANYHVVKNSPIYVLWARNTGPWRQSLPATWSKLTVKGTKIVMPTAPRASTPLVGQIKVTYSFTSANLLEKLYEKSARWLLQPMGPSFVTHLPTSLVPYQNEVSFPFVWSGDVTNHGSNVVELQPYNILPMKNRARITSAYISWVSLDPITAQAVTR